ncbi:MAG: MarR family transcriptional regulator, and catechol-resistance regulon repressor [Chloroflexota bacterium]|jgi:MarR family 2-MHQ and catechol resistance regulon transcriptional repressor|nr:MarR family transcriptional regulator, and catechol-resistance regulon repressor [Chloroflexota bacterium]
MYTAPMRLGELYRLGRRLQDLADRAMGGGRSFDFSVSEVIVVSDLLDHADSTIGDLSSRTGFAQSRVSTVVAALRDRGWIETAVDEADRRCTRVTLPEDVRRRATEARTKSATPVLAAALAGLSRERRDEVIAALEELHRALQGQRVSPNSRRRPRSEDRAPRGEPTER